MCSFVLFVACCVLLFVARCVSLIDVGSRFVFCLFVVVCCLLVGVCFVLFVV